jgi:PAS domain-containing protein
MNTGNSSDRPKRGVRLTRRLERSDPFLMRAVQVVALIGCILGILIYSLQVVHEDTQANRRALTEAATVGQLAAEADIARINSAAIEAAPLIAAAMAGGLSAARQRTLRADVTGLLARTPVTAIIVFGAHGEAVSVFGQLPADAAGAIGPRPTSRRAGGELLDLELVPVSKDRAAYHRDLKMANGQHVEAELVLRSNAFQPALQIGAAAGQDWRAALLNRDGETVLTAAGAKRVFDRADASLVVSALGWRPLHADESAATDRVVGQDGGRFVETRAVAGDMLQLAYIGEAPSVVSVLAARRYQFLAVLLAISVIQNEWQRHDRHVRDADLIAARAEITCDLLAAGVVDWSVSDGVVDYSEGWAEMFSQGDEPMHEEIFDWIARIHPDDRLAAREAYQAMLEGTQSELVHRMRIRMSSGLWVQVVERGRAIAASDGSVKRIVLVQTTEPVDGSGLRNAFGGATLPDARAV